MRQLFWHDNSAAPAACVLFWENRCFISPGHLTRPVGYRRGSQAPSAQTPAPHRPCSCRPTLPLWLPPPTPTSRTPWAHILTPVHILLPWKTDLTSLLDFRIVVLMCGMQSVLCIDLVSGNSLSQLTRFILIVSVDSVGLPCARGQACMLSHLSHVYNPIGCSLRGSSVHGVLQARTLEWVAMPSPT